jgi:general secretion pathway protein D
MKKKIGFLLLLFNSLAFAEQINLEKSNVGEFSKIVSDYLNKPIIVSTDIQKPLSINGIFKDKDELKALFKSAIESSNLNYSEDSLAIVVADKEKNQGSFLNSQNSPVFSSPISLLNGKTEKTELLPLTVISYALKNISSSQIFPMIKAYLSPGSSVIDSFGNNSIVITASNAEHEKLKKVIAALDFPTKQVLIEAVISELSDKDYKGLDAKLQNYRNLDAAADSITNSIANPLASLANFGMKLLTSKSLRFFLDWVQTSDSSNVLSQPKIVTLDRKEATITVGQNVPFITGKATSQASSTSTPFQTIERHDIGLKLQVTPTVMPNGTIELSILQENSSVDVDTTASDIVTSKRSVTSTALIRDGDTLLLGGLSSNSVANGHTGTIPKSLPWLNWLFSGNTQKNSNTNLIVMISAKVINTALPVLSELKE